MRDVWKEGFCNGEGEYFSEFRLTRFESHLRFERGKKDFGRCGKAKRVVIAGGPYAAGRFLRAVARPVMVNRAFAGWFMAGWVMTRQAMVRRAVTGGRGILFRRGGLADSPATAGIASVRVAGDSPGDLCEGDQQQAEEHSQKRPKGLSCC